MNRTITRRKTALKEIPDRVILMVNKTIERRLGLPAPLISVAGVFKLTINKCGIDKSENHMLNEGLYEYIARRLEQMGGIRTEFYSTATTKRRHKGANARAIYRFPPLKERKR